MVKFQLFQNTECLWAFDPNFGHIFRESSNCSGWLDSWKAFFKSMKISYAFFAWQTSLNDMSRTDGATRKWMRRQRQHDREIRRYHFPRKLNQRSRIPFIWTMFLRNYDVIKQRGRLISFSLISHQVLLFCFLWVIKIFNRLAGSFRACIKIVEKGKSFMIWSTRNRRILRFYMCLVEVPQYLF